MRRILAVLVVLAAFGPLAGPAPAQVPPVTIRLGALAEDELTPVVYAQKSGMFAKAGLNVDLQILNSGSATAAAVAGGAIDIGLSSLMPLINAHVHGVPFEMVAPGLLWLSGSPTAGLMTLKSSPIASGADLNGKTLSTKALKDLGEIGIRAWIDQNGGDSQTVHFIELPSPAVVPALESSRIVAANLIDPLYSDALAGGKVRVIGHTNDAIAKRFLTTAWFANVDYVRRNRAVVERFATVLSAAANYTNAHEAEMIPLVAPLWGIAPDALAKMNHGTIALVLDPRDIQPLIDVAAKYKAIDRRFNATEMISPAAAKLSSS
jgi:NitT/TauT family transport system substrate-binding protein